MTKAFKVVRDIEKIGDMSRDKKRLGVKRILEVFKILIGIDQEESESPQRVKIGRPIVLRYNSLSIVWEGHCMTLYIV